MTDETPSSANVVPAGAWLAPELRVVAHVHRGRHADTYQVIDPQGAPCLAKVMRPDRRDDAHAAASLHAEAARLAWLRHRCIPRGARLIDEPSGFLAEWISGPSLRVHMRGDGQLAWAEVARLGADVASALAYLHDAGLIHADVKPQNILVAPERFVLIDFELVRAAHIPGKGVGTRLFRSPEAVRGDVLESATDAWSLGVVLHRAATGRLPFLDEADPVARPPRVSASRAGGGALPAIIDALLTPDPRGRPLVEWLALELRRMVEELT